MILKKWGKLFSLAYFLVIASSPMIFPAGAIAIEIDPELENFFVSNETAGYTIYFRAKANLSEAPKTGWKEQSEFVSKALQDTANQSQARVRSYLFGRRVSYRSLWKENVIVVDRSDRDTFEGLKLFSEIESIKSLKMETKSPRNADPVETKDAVSSPNK